MRIAIILLSVCAMDKVHAQTLCQADPALVEASTPMVEEALRGADRLNPDSENYASRYRVPSDRFVDLTRIAEKVFKIYYEGQAESHRSDPEGLVAAVTIDYVLRLQVRCAGFSPALNSGLLEIAGEIMAHARNRLGTNDAKEIENARGGALAANGPVHCSAFNLILKQIEDEWKLREWLGEKVEAAKSRTALMRKVRPQICEEN